MQTSSIFLLVNFLAASITAGVGALGTLNSEADLKPPLPINHSTQEIHILSSSRGSGRMDNERPDNDTTVSSSRGSGRLDTEQPSNDTTAWRGSGRTQTDPEDREINQVDKKLAWRGSGRVQPDLDTELSNQVEGKIAWRGSGRVDTTPTGVNLDV